ncbi:MAG: sensor histidine kinase [Candidatus Methylomirabilales bacterium]
MSGAGADLPLLRAQRLTRVQAVALPAWLSAHLHFVVDALPPDCYQREPIAPLKLTARAFAHERHAQAMTGKRRPGLTTYLALLVVGTAVPLLIFAGLAMSWLVRSHHARQEEAQRETAGALALAADAEILSWRAALLTLAEVADLRARRWREFDRLARAVAARYDGWVVVNDAAGQQQANTLLPFGAPLPRTTAGQMVQAVIRDGLPLTDLVFGAAARRYIVSNSVPVFSDGKVIFCLSMNFGPEGLQRLLKRQGLPETWIAAIHDGRNRRVVRTGAAAETAGTPGPTWLPAAVAGAESGTVTGTIRDGREMRVAFQRLTAAPWVVSLAVPTAEARAAWRGPLLGFVAVAVLLTLAAVGLAVAVARRIAAPVVALAEQGQSMLRGEALAPVGANSREIEQLQRALAEAATRVQAYYEERERAARAEEAARAAKASEQALREIQEALRQSEERFAKTFRVAPVGITLVSLKDGRRREVNDTLLQMLGYTREEWLGSALTEREVWRRPAEREEMIRALLQTGAVQRREAEFTRKSGERFVSLVSLERLDIAGETYIVGSLTDITARKRAEEALAASLAEKDAALASNEALLREVHHRVKNNLQMLCDMVYLQMEGMEDERAAVLRDTYGRLYAIARVHEQLYQSMQSGQIAMGPYLERVLDGFRNLYATDLAFVAPDDGIALDLDRAIHLGLIVNELVTNALKHAFPGDRAGEVVVALRGADDRVELEVRDTGVGLPAAFSVEQARSLGLRIVHILAKRLEASVQVQSAGGTSFTIAFPRKADAPVEPAA